MLRRRSSRSRSAHVDPVDQHPAGGRIVEPRDQAHEHALAGAGGAEDRDALAGRHLEVDVPEDRLDARRRRTRHAVEADRAAEPGAARRAPGRLCTSIGRVEDLEHPPGADQRLLHAVDDVGDVVHLPGELFQQAGEHHQAGAERQAAVRDEPAAVAEQHHHVDPREKAHRRAEEAHPPEDALLLVEHGVVGCARTSARSSASRPNPLVTGIPWMLSARLRTMMSTRSRLRAYSGWMRRENSTAAIHSNGRRREAGQRSAPGAGSPCRST